MKLANNQITDSIYDRLIIFAEIAVSLPKTEFVFSSFEEYMSDMITRPVDTVNPDELEDYREMYAKDTAHAMVYNRLVNAIYDSFCDIIADNIVIRDGKLL